MFLCNLVLRNSEKEMSDPSTGSCFTGQYGSPCQWVSLYFFLLVSDPCSSPLHKSVLLLLCGVYTVQIDRGPRGGSSPPTDCLDISAWAHSALFAQLSCSQTHLIDLIPHKSIGPDTYPLASFGMSLFHKLTASLLVSAVFRTFCLPSLSTLPHFMSALEAELPPAVYCLVSIHLAVVLLFPACLGFFMFCVCPHCFTQHLSNS